MNERDEWAIFSMMSDALRPLLMTLDHLRVHALNYDVVWLAPAGTPLAKCREFMGIRVLVASVETPLLAHVGLGS